MSFMRVAAVTFAGLLAGCGEIVDAIVVSMVPRPQEPDERPYAVTEVSFPGGGEEVTLAGELTMPLDGGPFSAVILITGSGPQNRNEEVSGHKVFLVLSDYLTRRGYAVLRYDDRGIGQSSGDFSTATTLDFAADAAAALGWLRAQPAVDATRAGFAGHSEGGFVAPLAAAAERPDFMILIAGPSQVLSEVIVLQQTEIGRAQGISEAEVVENDRIVARILEVVRGSKSPGEVHDRLEVLLRDHGASETELRANLDLWATPWGLWIVDFDPRPSLAAYDGPVLALYGAKDLQVSAVANAPDMIASFAHGGSEMLVLPGLNHLFQPTETGSPDEYWQIETTFDEGAMTAIADWLDLTLSR